MSFKSKNLSTRLKKTQPCRNTLQRAIHSVIFIDAFLYCSTYCWSKAKKILQKCLNFIIPSASGPSYPLQETGNLIFLHRPMLGQKHGNHSKILRPRTSGQFVTKIICPDLNYTTAVHTFYITIPTAAIRSRNSSAGIVTSPRGAQFIV